MEYGFNRPVEVDFQAERLLSIDLFRGVAMFLLIAEASGLGNLLANLGLHGILARVVGSQFLHSPWIGLRAWDLGHPMFMFISGAAMFLSFRKRNEQGVPWKGALFQAAKRALVLFALGWAIYLIVPVEDNPHWAFLYDILPELAVGGMIAFLIMRWSVLAQLFFSFGLVGLTELLYRLWAAAGYGRPFAAGANFGSWLDRSVLGAASNEHWVTFNMVPFTAFVIWGALAGRVLAKPSGDWRKIGRFAAIGFAGVACGLALSLFTPIIRRIATSSFVILGGGACMLALALACWLTDVAKVGRSAVLFLAVGMNPLFIYLFAQTEGPEWLGRIAAPFVSGLAGWAGIRAVGVLTSLAVLAFLCGLCYWLYRRKIFIRI
jgi:predicted acyltransferase